MSESKPMASWQCDRCKRSGAALPIAEQPKGWLRLRMSSPPRRDVTDATIVDLCDLCDKDLAVFLRGSALAARLSEGSGS